jgi:hypothetical protein
MPRPRGIDVMGEPLFGKLTGEIRRLLYGHPDGATVAGGGGIT